MSDKRDKISNYNLSYLNMIEAANELEGFVNGLSNNDIFAFTDDTNLQEYIKKFQTDGAEENNDEEKFKEEIAVNVLDRTAGSYYVKDIVNGAVKNTILNAGDYIHIIASDATFPNGTGEINNFYDARPTYTSGSIPGQYYDLANMLTYKVYGENEVVSEYEIDEDLVGKGKKYKTKNEAIKEGAAVEFPKVKGDGEMSSPNSEVFNDSDPNRFKNPSLSSVVIKHPNIGILSKGKTHLPVFFNAINPVEMSKCVPYINIRVLTLDFSEKKTGSSIINLNFERDEMGSFKNVKPIKSFADNETSSDKNLENLDYTFMDLFTSPQMMSNANVNKQSFKLGTNQINKDPVLEPIMPLMTLKNLSVSITGAGFGIMSSKSANMSLVLHDRSRLRDIAPLVSSSRFATTKVEIEYGWNHPDGGVNSDNVFGRYLDALKEKSVFSVIGTDYKFGGGGEVNVDIRLAAYGYRQTERVHAGCGPIVPLNFLSDIIETAVNDIIKENDLNDVPEVRQKVRTAGRNARNITSTISWKNYKDIIDIINGNSESYSAEDENMSKNEILINAVKLILTPADKKPPESSNPKVEQVKGILETSGAFAHQDNTKKVVTEPIKALFGKIAAFKDPDHPDPFIYSHVKGSVIKELNEDQVSGVDNFNSILGQKIKGIASTLINNSNDNLIFGDEYVTLGKVLTSLIGYPLMSTCLYDEVQLVFYPLNHNAGAARRHTTASMPIPIEKLEKVINDQVKKNSYISVKSIFGLIEREIIRDKNLLVYGLSNIEYKDEKDVLSSISSMDQKIDVIDGLLNDGDNELINFEKLGERGIGDDGISKIVSGRKNGSQESKSDTLSSIKKSIESGKDYKPSNKYKDMDPDAVKAYSSLFDEYKKSISDNYQSKLESTLAEYYSNDGLGKTYKFSEVKFVRPNLTMDFEMIPVIDFKSSDQGDNSTIERSILKDIGRTFNSLNPYKDNETTMTGLKDGKVILRVHIYDEESVQSPSEHILLNNMINENSSRVISGTTESEFSIDDYLGSLKFWDVKQMVKRAYPTINYGSAGSTIKSISVGSKSNGAMANVLAVEAYGNLKNGNVKGFNYDNDFDTITVFPNEIQVEMLGMPMIGRGSSIFIDFNTNTSLDNIYTVKSVNHSLSSGQFNTSVALVPTNMGAINSFRDNIDRSIDKIQRSQTGAPVLDKPTEDSDPKTSDKLKEYFDRIL